MFIASSKHRPLRLILSSSLATASLLLGGCTLTLPVQGSLSTTPPTRFQGSATGHMDGAGELTITLDGGVRCSGQFVYVNGRQGSGIFNCADGRTGPFTFVSTGSRGTGSGRLNGVEFVFTFG